MHELSSAAHNWCPRGHAAFRAARISPVSATCYREKTEMRYSAIRIYNNPHACRIRPTHRPPIQAARPANSLQRRAMEQHGEGGSASKDVATGCIASPCQFRGGPGDRKSVV